MNDRIILLAICEQPGWGEDVIVTVRRWRDQLIEIRKQVGEEAPEENFSFWVSFARLMLADRIVPLQKSCNLTWRKMANHNDIVVVVA